MKINCRGNNKSGLAFSSQNEERSHVCPHYTRSPLQDSRLFGPRPWKILATTYETNGFLSNPAPGENLLSGNLVMETGWYSWSAMSLVITIGISNHENNNNNNVRKDKTIMWCDCCQQFSPSGDCFWVNVYQKTITWSENCPKPSHHMIVFSLPKYVLYIYMCITITIAITISVCTIVH